MKYILALIEEKQQVYSQLPFFKFLQDESIEPIQRLAFAPCAAPFIMSFSDLNKYVVRQEPTNDKIQAILNQHTYEDDFHWQWFLEDMEKLGFNCSLQLNDALEFFWNEDTKNSRLLTHELYRYIAQSKPIEKLIIVKSIEATAKICLSLTEKLTNKLQFNTSQKFKYFGDCHLNLEISHNTHSNDVRKFLENIYIAETERQNSIQLVEKVFELFTQWTYSLLSYAQNYPVSQPIGKQEREQKLQVSSI